MRVAVIGATGRIGRRTAQALRRAGHSVVPVSRSAGVDVLDAEALVAPLAGVDTVVDVTSTAPRTAAEAVAFFAAVSRNLLAAAHRAGVRHHVLLSIVGIDDIAGNPHYAGKRAQEAAVVDGTIPYSIVRATQFHDFPYMVAERGRTEDGIVLAPLLLQPIAPDDVAAILAEVAAGEPRGRSEIAGPYPEDMIDMARRIFTARGEVVRLIPTWDGPFGVEMAGPVLLPHGAGGPVRLAPTSFDAWLAAGPDL